MATNAEIEINAGLRLAIGEAQRDVVVVPIAGEKDFHNDKAIKKLDDAAAGILAEALTRGVFTGDKSDCLVTGLAGNPWNARHVAFVGVKSDGRSDTNILRDAAALSARTCRKRRFRDAVLLLRGMEFDGRLVQAAAEGLSIGCFMDNRYKTSTDLSEPTAFSVVCAGEEPEGFVDQCNRGAIIGKHLNIARQWVNDPAGHLTPRQYAVEACEHAKSVGLDVQVLERGEIQELGMGLLLGVAQGSVEEPRLLVLRHKPNPGNDDLLALIGKGVTFDSGGISIKPASGMEWMKKDMAGSAAVIGAMGAIAELGVGRNVVGIVPMVENMPSGTAIRPGDVLTGAGKDTVEVINTDAEGRLILGDALWYARQLGAKQLVDVATLTGACVVALGNAASGLFGRSDEWVEEVRAASGRAGEPLWHLPLYDDYADQLKSAVADIKNTGTRAGGACTAAAFLHHFVKDCDWAHIDIAGTAWLELASATRTSGATGVMMRTLVELARTDRDW